ncbi:FtsX-like permease family protein [Streptomyces sp. NPDC088725]|uniref:FtsX-like permease family protein n=1 Tax=Streptomyces sp. NPDC088725 TaxID=3365873 RepID=UPI00381A1226
MRAWYHSWRAAVRIARRDAWRYKGRSFLVLAMIALPILGVSALDLTVRGSQLSAEESTTRSMGAADVRFSDPRYAGEPILQSPDGLLYTPEKDYGDDPWPNGPTDLTTVLPAGGKTLTDTVGSGKLRTAYGVLNTQIHELKAADPLAGGIMRLTSGRFPAKSGEVAATTHFLEISGLQVGSKLTARGLDSDYRIVGAYELPSELKTDEVNALPGALLAPLDKALKAKGLSSTRSTTTRLAATPGGFTWNMVAKANKKGVVAVSREVALNPPSRSEVPLYQKPGWDSSGRDSGPTAEDLAALGTVVGLAMLEICLLAGPAFAVGARRSRRQLGLVGANGGDRRHIRAIVLAGGLVIGVAAAIVGTALGLGLTLALRTVLEDIMGKRFGGFGIRPVELLAIALLAVVTGLLAAIVPAITSSRQTVLASLTGRRGSRRTGRTLPVLGFIAFVLGAAIALYGSTMTDQSIVVAGGSALAELGVVALTPALVGLFGKAGRLLPLSPRLALRDAVRNRGRTAPAVAAVLAAIAGTVAVSTYSASLEAKNRAEYEPRLPNGAISLLITEEGGRDVPAAREAIEKNMPVEVAADVDRVVLGKRGCAVESQPGDGCGAYEFVVPKANRCPLWTTQPDGSQQPVTGLSSAERRKLFKDWRCREPRGFNNIDVVVGDASLLTVLGIDDPEAAKALSAGQVVSFDKRYLEKSAGTGESDHVGIRLVDDADKESEAIEQGKKYPSRVKALPAHQVPDGSNAYGLKLLMPPAAARATGFTTVPVGSYYSTTAMPSSAQRQKVDEALDRTGGAIDLHVEEGYVSESSIVLLALTIFAGLVTVGAAGIATGLAQADAEADLKTLAAVGAPARVRRTLSAFQCGVVAAMGVVLGTAAGVLPAIGLRLTERREQTHAYWEMLDQSVGGAELPYIPIVLPWGTLAGLLITVPLGAALLAALFTRSHKSLSRRAAT